MKAAEGVLYYNHGRQCLIRILVSMLSLRRHYQGEIAVAAEGDPPDWFLDMAGSFGAKIVAAPVSHEYGLIKKSRIWRVSPFDCTLFLDADTLVRAPVDSLFKGIKKRGLLVTQFCDWVTYRGRMRRRIEQWRSIVPENVERALAYGFGINTGIMGWTRANPLMEQYEQMTARGLGVRGIQRKTLDELAMQLVIVGRRHYLATGEWNTGCIHGDVEAAKIVHYHGHKHCRPGKPGDLWKAEFWALVEKFPKHANTLLTQTDDRSLCKWLKDELGRRKDLTVVTAVNPQYAHRAATNLKKWLGLPGLKDQRIVVFVNGFKNAASRKFLDLPNVKVIRWDYPFPGATPRETMLAAFVLGTAQHVSTDYWMKLDCDSAPLKPYWRWPDYRSFTVTSHKWGYTKMKGEPNAPDHWFTRLDNLFANGQPVFKLPLDPVKDFKLSHRRGNPNGVGMRFASFCHIERTEFTRRVAGMVREKCYGRLPIPSHDTLTWYFTALWREAVKLMNMKEWFNP